MTRVRYRVVDERVTAIRAADQLGRGLEAFLEGEDRLVTSTFALSGVGAGNGLRDAGGHGALEQPAVVRIGWALGGSRQRTRDKLDGATNQASCDMVNALNKIQIQKNGLYAHERSWTNMKITGKGRVCVHVCDRSYPGPEMFMASRFQVSICMGEICIAVGESTTSA